MCVCACVCMRVCACVKRTAQSFLSLHIALSGTMVFYQVVSFSTDVANTQILCAHGVTPPDSGGSGGGGGGAPGARAPPPPPPPLSFV